MYRLTGIYLYNAECYTNIVLHYAALYKTRYCSLIVSHSREWVSQLGWEMLYKRKRRLVMAIAAIVLVLVKSMETTRIL